MQNITTMNNCRRSRSKSSPISGRKQQPQPATALSASSMGKALVLLHLASSATAFSPGTAGNSITPSTTIRQPQHTVLQYRNGADEYFAIPTPSSYMGVSSSSSTPTLKPTTEIIKEEQDMDEYLDYLQNRYTRMHHHHPNKRRRRHPPSRSIVMMTTIFARLVPPTISSSTAEDDTSSSFQEEEEEQCHPLKVLGVSELASQRLRERLQVVSSSNAINTRRRRSVAFVQLKQMTNRILSSIRMMTNFFSLNVLVNKAGREFLVASSLAMLLLVRPLLRGTFRQG